MEVIGDINSCGHYGLLFLILMCRSVDVFP